MQLRKLLKRTVERSLAATGPAAVARRSRRGSALILAYHNVVPRGETVCGDLSLHLPQAAFAEQLDSLVRTHDVVPLRTLLRERNGARPARPRVAITFDDAYLGAITAGAYELAKRNLPATIFVAPAFLGGGSFWWDALATAGLDATVRDGALHEARGIDAEVRAWAARRRIATTEPPTWARCASESDLRSALAALPLDIASHTWSHPNLTRLSAAELRDEMTRPLEWLARFGARSVPIISYPYGLADDRVHDAARSAGYDSGLMIAGGWASQAIAGQFDVPRLNVPAGISRDGFVLCGAGLLGD